MDILNSFKTLVNTEKIQIDNNVFKLHYNFTVVMLLLFSIVLSSKQYFGEPINCFSDTYNLKEIMDTFCWINGTYIIKENLLDVVIPGGGSEAGKHKLWIKYYQWVAIVFCLQAMFFYVPHYVWKSWEGSRMQCLVENLGGPLVTDKWTEDRKKRLVNYMINVKYDHNIYAVRYAFCEILNFVNVILQILLLDWLVTGNFTFYGIALGFYKGANPTNAIFPKLTKCRFDRFGPSGGIEKHDAICVLSLNILNEKLFLVLWVWLYFLVFVSFFAVVYRAVIFFVFKVRFYMLRAQVRDLKVKQANTVANKLSFGDFFVLYRIGKNVNPIVYSDLVVGIYEGLLKRVSYQSLYDIEKNIDGVN